VFSQPKIVALVDLKGEISLEVSGVQGPSCTDLTAKLEKALGPVGNQQQKPEFYAKPIEAGVTTKGSF
jgi:hypothetical protein